MQPSRFLIEAIELGLRWNKFSHPQQTHKSVGLLPQLWSHGKKGWVSVKKTVIQGVFKLSHSSLPPTQILVIQQIIVLFFLNPADLKNIFYLYIDLYQCH